MKPIMCFIIFHTVFCDNNYIIEVENEPKKKELSSAEMFEEELSTSYEYASEEDKEVLKKMKKGKDYDNSPDEKAKSLNLFRAGKKH